MARAALEEVEKLQGELPPGKRHLNWWVLLIIFAAIGLFGFAIYLQQNWPFAEANVVKQLSTSTSSTVHIATFKQVFFPHPGCIAQGVTFERGGDNDRTTMTVQQLTIESSIAGLLAKHLAIVRLDGAKIMFPEFGTSPSWKPTNSEIVIDELTASNAVLEFARRDPKQPKVTFAVHQFVGQHLASHDAMSFEVRLKNPTPPGEIVVNGSFGPWNMEQLSATPVSGKYTFRDANLGVFHGIRGILASDGQFNGTLETIAVNGDTTTPAFAVDGNAHELPLDTMFKASVDPANGDVALERVQARLLRTIVVTRGTIAAKTGKPGKTAALEMTVRNGRIQDLLLPFISEKKSPLNGTINLKAKTMVPSGNVPFLKKLHLVGDFGIESALFTKEETQRDLDKLSAAARGQADQSENPEDVVSDLQGHVVVNDGIATFSDLRFRVPGGRARLEGTFNLLNQKVELRGLLFMDAKLPEATSGIKSFLLKAIDPFLKKNRHGGARIPVRITGTYYHPSYKADPI